MSPDAPSRQKPGRCSTIASHPACAEIELACARGTSLRRVAKRFGVSRAAVDRHWHGLPVQHRACLAELAADLDRSEARIREVYAALAVLVPAQRSRRITSAGEMARAA